MRDGRYGRVVLVSLWLLAAAARPSSARAATTGEEALLFAPTEAVSAASRFDQPEALSVRGFFVTDDHSCSHLGSRGFCRPADYNVRVLPQVDGRRLEGLVYDLALVGTEALVDRDLVR